MLLSTYEKNADSKDYLKLAKHLPSADETYKHLAHFHNSVEFMIVISGECRLRVNAEERVMRAYDAAFIGSFDVHKYTPSLNCEYYYFLIGSDYFDGENMLGSVSFEPYLLSSEGRSEIMELLDFVYPKWGSADRLFKIGVANMLLGLIKTHFSPKVRENRRQSELHSSVLRYINENIKGDISVGSISLRFGYTPNYFSSLFNKLTGMSFREYLNSARITEFERIRRSNAEISVGAAAREAGFDSLNTFYRAYNKFKREKS